MKQIAVIGLGIIGGSICASLTRAGYVVDGFSRNGQTAVRAQERGYIRRPCSAFDEYDVVFIAVPPEATLRYLRQGKFKDGALVVDICGVKKAPEIAVYESVKNYRYVGIHPMAGKETSGLDSASADLFTGANLIITHAPQTQLQDVTEVKTYAKQMGFGTIVECTAEEHDKKIALTSQLAHIVSNAYVKSPQVQGCDGFTGGSFQDMTRIAGVDETVWTPLYACNRENIVGELDGLIGHLSAYRDALSNGDDQRLAQLLKDGRLIRETVRRPND